MGSISSPKLNALRRSRSVLGSDERLVKQVRHVYNMFRITRI